MRKVWLVSIMAFVLAGVYPRRETVLGAGDENLIPPEVLKHMDPEIRTGKRPTIAKIRQSDIFGLREKPRFEEDFVAFDFSPKELSSVQREIVEKWIRQGSNKVYVEGDQKKTYSPLFEPAKYGGEVAGTRCKLLIHVVNTDCRLDALYGRTVSPSCLDSLGQDAVVIIGTDKGQAVCGAFHLGECTVYFRSRPSGTDSRRWDLNWWHWSMGLGVPGAASTDVLGGGSSGLTLDEAVKYDAMILKNGDTITGTIGNESFRLKTSYADLTIKSVEIEKIVFEGAGNNVDVLRMRIGDKLSGVIQDKKIMIELVSGTGVEIDKEKVKEIQMRKSG